LFKSLTVAISLVSIVTPPRVNGLANSPYWTPEYNPSNVRGNCGKSHLSRDYRISVLQRMSVTARSEKLPTVAREFCARVPEISYLSSATPLAAVALWFALRSYYVSAVQQAGITRRKPWFEITTGLVLGVLGIQYIISQKYQSDFAATRDALTSTQRDLRDIRQDQANQKEVQRRIDSLQQQIDALKSQPRH
jgi:hypothetical protein